MDEIDAIGGRRFSEGTSADREIQRTLMELLNQMDGFDRLGQVKMIMATNRPDVLDPALLRPGRLDRKIGERESGWTFLQSFFYLLLPYLPLSFFSFLLPFLLSPFSYPTHSFSSSFSSLFPSTEIPLPNEQARLDILKIHASPITKHGEIGTVPPHKMC